MKWHFLLLILVSEITPIIAEDNNVIKERISEHTVLSFPAFVVIILVIYARRRKYKKK